MDKAAIKLLLDSYRPQDADDPLFADALRAAADDPELAAWFAEAQRFDAIMSAKFQELPVPAEVKSHILLGQRASSTIAFPTQRSRRTGWIIAGALAAVLLIGAFSWRFFAPVRPRPTADPLALQAIAFTNQMPSLQFVCFDAKAVAGWINAQPGSRQIGLNLPQPAAALSMKMIGSSVVDWNGRPVVMVCLQNGRQMAMLYILKEPAGTGAATGDGVTNVIQQGDWVVRTTRSDGQVRLLTTKGRPEDLNFPMPF